jgi:hypothetical protein
MPRIEEHFASTAWRFPEKRQSTAGTYLKASSLQAKIFPEKGMTPFQPCLFPLPATIYLISYVRVIF